MDCVMFCRGINIVEGESISLSKQNATEGVDAC